MTSMDEEIFDITKNERLSFVTGPRGSSKVRQFENQSGARIRVDSEPSNTMIRIFGNSSQREEAKILIRDTLEKTSFIPTVSYFILSESSFDNNRLKFVEADEESSNGRTRYFVKFIKDDDDEYNEPDELDEVNIEDYLHITPCQFNTFDKLDDCLDILSSKLKSNFRQRSADSLFSEKIILKPRIFFGKVLFFEMDNPKDSFTLRDWYKFNVLSGRGRRGSTGEDNGNRDGKTVNVEFQQDSPQVYEDFKVLQQKFGFKVHHKRPSKDKTKGCVYIYYTPTSTNKKRKLKLRWDEDENKWKVVNHSHSINRLANFDIVSGSKAPDFRFSLKTHYDLSSEGSKVEEIINNIQFSNSFAERDGMWFKSNDFSDTLMQKAVIRQVIEKKSFRNESYHITFATIKHCDINNRISTQKLITLKHHTWAQSVTLNNTEAFMNNVFDTLNYVQDMISTLL
ncbi:unnamed protein product [Rhizophagus irregularis]|uniref:K Homology domain-containing protein n=1 Tax=Rhizophagus irregularis TaxID=588596 RepID=A0A2N1NEA6_9GLOM|nr:hypothetical protein RhiirC2_743324 [Rhizophagus irregularis]CAB4389537.1 unnamed protein product [Rhizophagus irregularis]CAB5319349.1 unnamed protein product [Rhizophagus irregularis]CAB5391787.1 unnamed protein product [Rhizophagus irregularis]